MVKLMYTVVGVGGGFVVEIDTGELVADLKALIHEKCSLCRGHDVMKLELFLAKRGSSWLKTGSDEGRAVRSGEVPDAIKELMRDELRMDESYELSADRYFGKNFHRANGDLHVLVRPLQVQIQLVCVIVGVGSAFLVEIDPAKSVNSLKALIKETCPDIRGCEARDLDLYLAKRGGSWLKSDSDEGQAVRSGEVPDTVTELMRDELRMDESYELSADRYFGKNFHRANGDLHVLVRLPQVQIQLMCVIVGARNAFPVEIDPAKSVNSLKVLIKETCPVRLGCATVDVKLYLAKRGGSWLKSDSDEGRAVRSGEVRNTIKELMRDGLRMYESFKLNADRHLGESFQRASGDVHVLVELPEKQVQAAAEAYHANLHTDTRHKRWRELSDIEDTNEAAKEKKMKS